jgi:hypothetical protein
MSAQDYRVNAEVRRLLVSRWIDVSRVQIGTTNGVVYLMGTLEPSVEDALERAGVSVESHSAVERLLRLVVVIEKDLRRIRGVRYIVFNLRNIRKKGRSWSVVGAAGSDGPVKAVGTRRSGSESSRLQDFPDETEDERIRDAETSRRH